jgi:hypothetical protein
MRLHMLRTRMHTLRARVGCTCGPPWLARDEGAADAGGHADAAGYARPDPEFAHMLCWMSERIPKLLWYRSFFLRDRRF